MDRLLKLTEEEKQVVMQVRRNNFFFVVVPLSVGSMYLCRTMMSRGKISTTYGFAKIGGAGLFAYIIGKSFLPSQIAKALYSRCPDGEFVKMADKFKTLSPEERRDYILKERDSLKSGQRVQYGTQKTAPETSVESSGQQLPKSEVQTTEASKPSFSYAEQREKYSNTPTSYSKNVPESSSTPSPSPAQPANVPFGDNKPIVPSNIADSKPLPQDQPSPTVSSGRKVRRNLYGDEIE